MFLFRGQTSKYRESQSRSMAEQMLGPLQSMLDDPEASSDDGEECGDLMTMEYENFQVHDTAAPKQDVHASQDHASSDVRAVRFTRPSHIMEDMTHHTDYDLKAVARRPVCGLIPQRLAKMRRQSSIDILKEVLQPDMMSLAAENGSSINNVHALDDDYRELEIGRSFTPSMIT